MARLTGPQTIHIPEGGHIEFSKMEGCTSYLLDIPEAFAALCQSDREWVIAQATTLLNRAPMTPPEAVLPDRYGRTKIATIRRDFDKLREAVQRHDAEATEDAWLACERWVDFVFAMAVRRPGAPEGAADE